MGISLAPHRENYASKNTVMTPNQKTPEIISPLPADRRPSL